MRILIVSICILVVGATIGTIMVGRRTFEGVVVDKPYEAGLMWDQVRLKTANLGWTVSLPDTAFKMGNNDVLISVFDKNKRPLADAVVCIALSRPSTSAYDRTFQARREQDGRYRVSIDLPEFGYWDLRIDVTSNKQQGSYMNRIYAKQRA
jgi:nitrogen fixation protein FixH